MGKREICSTYNAMIWYMERPIGIHVDENGFEYVHDTKVPICLCCYYADEMFSLDGTPCISCVGVSDTDKSYFKPKGGSQSDNNRPQGKRTSAG